MKYLKYLKYILFLAAVIILAMFLKQRILDLVRDVATSSNQKQGIIDKNAIRWCSFPLSHDLDQGGVPFDIQDVTHPSIVYVPNGFNGYDCWVATTPYPCSLPTSGEPYENTCIYFANTDNNTFPVNFNAINQNPIILKSGAKYNSDPDLLYDEDNNCLYAITRKRKSHDYETNIVVQKSFDGQIWSNPISLFITNTYSLCPCIVKTNEAYRVYTFEVDTDRKKTTKEIVVWEGRSLDNPSFEIVKRVKWTLPSNFWHGDIYFHNGKYFMVYCGTHKDNKTIFGSEDLSKYMWVAISEDGYHFKALDKPLLQMNGVYRSSIVIVNEKLVVYFSVSNRYRENKKQYPYGNRVALVEYPLNKLFDD